MRVIPERRSVPFNCEIQAEITAPGTLPGTISGEVRSLEPMAGKRLSSFLIRYNPVGVISGEKFLRFRQIEPPWVDAVAGHPRLATGMQSKR